MNWKKMPKEKRTHLILVVIITLIALVGLGYGLIRSQYQSLAQLDRKKADTQAKLKQMQDTIKNATKIESQLKEATAELQRQEEQMAFGDNNVWMVSTLRKSLTDHKVEITSSSTPDLGEMSMLPRFPYKQTTATVLGSAYYHDLGKFLAAFENEFPHVRIMNLDLAPAGDPKPKEQLTFKLVIAALVRPTGS